MTNPIENASAGTMSTASSARFIITNAYSLLFIGPETIKKKRPRGHRKPLNRLDSDKEIQGNASDFSLISFGWAWLYFAGFG
jgi:hypothetical protein